MQEKPYTRWETYSDRVTPNLRGRRANSRTCVGDACLTFATTGWHLEKARRPTWLARVIANATPQLACSTRGEGWARGPAGGRCVRPANNAHTRRDQAGRQLADTRGAELRLARIRLSAKAICSKAGRSIAGEEEFNSEPVNPTYCNRQEAEQGGRLQWNGVPGRDDRR